MGSWVEPKFNFVEREINFVLSRRLRTRDCIKYIKRRLFFASYLLQRLKFRVLRDVYYMICRVRDNRPARTVAEAFTFMLTVRRYKRVMELGRRLFSISAKIHRFLKYMIDENLWHVSPVCFFLTRALTLLPSYTMDLDIKTISEPGCGICEELQNSFLHFVLDDIYNLSYDIRKFLFCKSFVARLEYHI